MRADVRLEVPWIPHLAHELAEALRQQAHDVTGGQLDVDVVLLLEKVVPQGYDMRQGLSVRGMYLQISNF